MRGKAEKLLTEFYKGRVVDKEVKLGFRHIGYGFRIQSNWLTEFEKKREKKSLKTG